MASQTLQRMEEALAKVPAASLVEVLAELQEIADSDPGNPAPHLAMAMVSGFHTGKVDPEAPKRHLDHAERLLEGPRRADAEWEFAENLFTALKSEYALAGLRRLPRLGAAEIESRISAETEHRRAMGEMGRLLRRIPGSRLLNVIYAALRALSVANGPHGDEYRRGMNTLSTIFRGRHGVNDLAGFFQVYGYRRARNYTQAIRVGRSLEQRNPASPGVKKLLGGTYFFAQKDDDARRVFEEAIELAPDESSSHLCLSVLLDRMGDTQGARGALERAESLDRRREFTSVFEHVETRIRMRERIG